MMLKNIDLSSINNDLWNKKHLVKLTNYLFDTDVKIYKRVFFTHLYTKFVKEILESLLNINNDVILKIYWNEFKSFRKTFKQSYDDIVNKTVNSDARNITHTIKELFDKENIGYTESESVFDNIEHYMESNRNKQCIQCKICYNISVTYILEHEAHGCSICSECAEKFLINTPCPFCKLPIIGKKKLFIR